MALEYLIDGYNLIHALGLVHKRIVPKELERARADLLHFLHERLEPFAHAITVIFDAKRKPRHVPSEFQEGRILIRYAGRREEADDVIEALLIQHAAPARLIVVSEDRRLRQAAARRHARSLGCEELLEHMERASARRASGPCGGVAGDRADEGGSGGMAARVWRHRDPRRVSGFP